MFEHAQIDLFIPDMVEVRLKDLFYEPDDLVSNGMRVMGLDKQQGWLAAYLVDEQLTLGNFPVMRGVL